MSYRWGRYPTAAEAAEAKAKADARIEANIAAYADSLTGESPPGRSWGIRETVRGDRTGRSGLCPQHAAAMAAHRAEHQTTKAPAVAGA